MKKKLLLLFTILAIGLSNVWAYDFSAVAPTGQTLYYRFTSNSTVEVTCPESFQYWNGYAKPTGDLNIPASIFRNGITYSVTSISVSAFKDCGELTGVTIPNSMTKIGAYAFSGCRDLASVIIGDSVTEIEWSAFKDCFSLTSIVIPNSVTSMGSDVFSGCRSLESAELSTSLTSIPGSAFSRCDHLTSVTIPNSVTSIGQWAFFGCTRLSNVIIGNSVEVIESQAFNGCSELTSVIIPNSVTTIASAVFLNCSSLRHVMIPNSVTYIGDEAFEYCSSLRHVMIPNSVTTIGVNAFSGVGAITYCGSAAGNPWGANNAGCFYMEDDFIYTSSTKDTVVGYIGSETRITIPEYVSAIANRAFNNNRQLNLIVVPDLVSSIGDEAFTGVHTVIYCGPVHKPEWSAYDHQGLLHIGCYFVDGDFVYSYDREGNLRLESYIGDETNVLDIPDSVHTIGRQIIRIGHHIQQLNIPGSVIQIGRGASDCWIEAQLGIEVCLYEDDVYALKGVHLANYCAFPWVSDTLIVSASNFGRLQLNSRQDACGVNVFSDDGYVHLGYYTVVGYYDDFGDTTFVVDDGLCIDNSFRLRPWTADYFGCYHTEGDFIYTSSVKDTLIGYIGSATDVVIPSTVTTIGTKVFAYRDDIVSVTIPNSVTSIGDSAFEKCSGLTNITISNSLTSIGTSAFSWCTGITSVIIPESVTNIGAWAFASCGNLNHITFNATNCTTMGEDIDGSYHPVFQNENTSIDLTIGENVRSIPAHAFQFCNGIRDVVILNSVTSIGDYAFAYLELGNVIIGDSVVSIGESAFRESCKDCKVTIGRSVNSIGAYAFYSGYDLDTVFALGEIPATLGYTALPRAKACVVSCASVDLYRQAGYPNVVGRLEYDYSITSEDPAKGTIVIDTIPSCTISTLTFSAVPKYGYHFVQWNDGDTNNPRSLSISCDTNFVAQFVSNFYTIEVLSDDTVMGRVEGDTILPYMSQDTLRAIASPGCHFVQWNDGNTDNPRVVAADSNKTFVAQFEDNVYTVTASSSDSTMGLITFFSMLQLGEDNDSGPSNIPFVSSYCNSTNESLYLASEIGAAGRIDTISYFCNSAQELNFNNLKIYMGHTTTDNLNDGWVGFDSLQLVYQRANGQIGSAVGKESYALDTPFEYDGVRNLVVVVCRQSNSYVYTLTYQHSYYGSTFGCYRKSDVDATYGSLESGAIGIPINTRAVIELSFNRNMSGEALIRTHGDMVTIEAVPSQGNIFSQWSDGNNENPRTLTVTQDYNLVAQFIPLSYTVSVESADITMGSTSYEIIASTDVTLTISAEANYGYHFVQWNDGDTNNPRSLTMTCDTAFVAQFAPNQYSVEVSSANTTMGSVEGNAVLDYLMIDTISATANYGYHFVRWQDGNTENPRGIVADSNKSYVAQFANNQYTVMGSSSDSNNGAVLGSGTFEYLSSATLSVVAFSGYVFTQWSDGTTQNPYTFTVTRDTFLYAQYAPYPGESEHVHDTTIIHDTIITYIPVHDTTIINNFIHDTTTITQWQYDTTFVNVFVPVHDTTFIDNYIHDTTIVNNYIHDTTTVTQWQYDTTYVNVYVPVHDTTIINNYIHDTTIVNNYIHDTTIVNNYIHDTTFVELLVHDTLTITEELNWYVLNVVSGDAARGLVAGNGRFPENTEVEIAAIPIEGSRFVQWQDGNTDNPRTVTMAGDMNFVATFDVSNESVTDVDMIQHSVTTRLGQIVVENAGDAQIRIFDNLGRCLSTTKSMEQVRVFNMPASGAYMVQVGNCPAQKVIVIK